MRTLKNLSQSNSKGKEPRVINMKATFGFLDRTGSKISFITTRDAISSYSLRISEAAGSEKALLQPLEVLNTLQPELYFWILEKTRNKQAKESKVTIHVGLEIWRGRGWICMTIFPSFQMLMKHFMQNHFQVNLHIQAYILYI